MENKTLILGIDDDTAIGRVIELEFEDDEDYRLKFFSDPSIFKSNLTPDVDLVIMDINMPSFDVVSAVAEVDSLSPLAYVIIISADRNFNTLKELTNLGIFRFCEKDPYNFLPRLRECVAAAHRKISFRKGIMVKNGLEDIN